ncbi:MAG: NAD(P)-dependent oxidoreductase [bacterium]|nr:NAD(P)-dependent oxidoreductase [bacterium]
MDLTGRILVTGGTGFIGRRLVDRLLGMNVEVVSFALPDEAVPDHWGERVRVLRGDITTPTDVRAAMAGIDTVFHLAAVVGLGSYEEHWRITVEGSRHVCEAAVSEGAKVMLASSIVVYGDQIQTERCHEGLEHGRFQGAYSRAKMAQEKLALEYHSERALKLVVVRPANVYGAGSGPWVNMLIGLMQADALNVIGDGSGNAGLVHVANLVEAFVLAAADPNSNGQIYTACDGLDVTWARYCDDLAAMIGKAPPPRVPLESLVQAAREHENPEALEQMEGMPTLPLELVNLMGYSNCFETAKIRKELGWQPKVSYSEALDEIRASLETAPAPS